jgi:hypothetical protein
MSSVLISESEKTFVLHGVQVSRFERTSKLISSLLSYLKLRMMCGLMAVAGRMYDQ